MLATVYLDGKKLKRIRTLKGKTQRALSSESGVSTSTIWLLERREKNENFHPPTLTKLARALGVEPTDLVSGESSYPPPKATPPTRNGQRCLRG